ncbi:hypothetical protein [Burkholderia perseverans]|uniref:hypothetical protein n=1 Tax=Burkholderia perseverans TaxID=2615214 RepID=UPI001FEE36DF|nr:hypothetical protein [Burkholderia perseverans]
MRKLEAMVTSPPDRQNIVFEIWFDDREVAEISKEPGRGYEIEIYARAENGVWSFDLDEFKSILERGVKELSDNL